MDFYIPFSYLEKVKRANENYTLKVILGDDLPVLLFAFAWQPFNITLQISSIVFLLISFWCMYETGYYENDLVAEKYEEQPKIAAAYYAHKSMMTNWIPWLWSFAFGLLGIICLEKAQGVRYLFYFSGLELKIASIHPAILMACYWTIFLLSTRLCFWIFNHFNKHTRTWFYIVLQSFRYYGFIAVTYVNPIGTSLLSSNILARSILYVVYRYSGGKSQDWPAQLPEKVLRCLIFILILCATCFSVQSFALWQTWQTWLIIAWFLVQGKGQFIKIFAQIKPVFKDGSNFVGSTLS